MKTPRDILLGKHSGANSKLDAIRLEAIGQESPPRAEQAHPGILLASLSQLWAQLVLPSRRVWSGLAAIWLIVVAVNFAIPEDDSLVYSATRPPKANPQQQLALREQRQLFAELLNGTATSEPEARPYVPRPSSSRKTLSIRFA